MVEKNSHRHLAKKENTDGTRRHLVRSIPFFLAMAAVTVIAWLLPLRPTVSDAEKRELSAFPKFSVSALFDGSYFSGIDAWFSDTFTFRDSWIDKAQSFKDLYGINTVVIYGETAASDAVPVPPPSGHTDAAPQPEQPRDAPAETEEASEEPSAPEAPEEIVPDETSVSEDSGLNESTSEEWGGVEIDDDDFVGVGRVLQIGDAAYKITVFVKYHADRFVELMGTAAEKLDGIANVYCLIVPENTTSMLKAEDRIKYGCVLEEDVLAYMYGNMDPRVKTVDPIPEMVAHNNEYICFRTDHHWTARGAYYAYVAWCKVAGVEPVPLSEYREIAWPGYLGTYYYKANQNKYMAENPDTVYAYEPPGDVHMYMDFNVSTELGKEHELLYDRTHSASGALYQTFLGTDRAKVTFINNDITDGSSCLAIKTSFGNPFVYYLTQHYQYVYVLDIRYTNNFTLTKFVDLYDIDDVLFVVGTGLTESKGGISLTDYFINHRTKK